jgi:hypothetical protein
MEAMMADNKKDQQDARGNAQRDDGDDAFAQAPADGNVFPPGAPQTSHGSATGPINGGAPAPTGGDRNRQQAMGGAASGGQPGTTAPRDADAGTSDKA